MIEIPTPEYGVDFADKVSAYLCSWGLKLQGDRERPGLALLGVEELAEALEEEACTTFSGAVISNLRSLSKREKEGAIKWETLIGRTAPRAAEWVLEHYRPEFREVARERGRRSGEVRRDQRGSRRTVTSYHLNLPEVQGMDVRQLAEHFSVDRSTIYRSKEIARRFAAEQAALREERAGWVDPLMVELEEEQRAEDQRPRQTPEEIDAELLLLLGPEPAGPIDDRDVHQPVRTTQQSQGGYQAISEYIDALLDDLDGSPTRRKA